MQRSLRKRMQSTFFEACNFFRINAKNSEWTLVLNHEKTKKFVRLFLDEVFKNMGLDVEIKEDLMKLRLRLSNHQRR